MSLNIDNISTVPVSQHSGRTNINPNQIRTDVVGGQFDEISVANIERRVSSEAIQIPITLTAEQEIIGLLTLKGNKGDPGSSIVSIEKTSTSGLVDTYTITMSDWSTSTFTVTNGEEGDPGVGILSIEKTSTSGLVDTYTITYSNGNTDTFTVTNGAGGSWGAITGTLSDQTDLKNALDSKADTADLGSLASKNKVDWDTDIDDIPATFPPSVHNHDDRYYTETEVDAKLQPMYGYCETASNVVAKTVSISNFTLVTGRTVFIKFEHENTADDPTLNISNTGAISIVRYGTDPASEDKITWSDGEVKCFTYDGTSWIESGGAGGSDREDTISFHGSDMIVEPGTNRITFDDSDMIIHPPDGAAWLERTMEALEGGIAIISTNNEHSAIANGQYVYIRMHTTLPDGLYKATTDIAQNAELTASNVTSASGALNDKSNVGHTHRMILDNTNNKITTIADDTIANWSALGNCICTYSVAGQITNQPSTCGILLNTVTGYEVSQLWFTQGNGKIYRRSGNASGWWNSSKWYELYQENGSVIPIGNGGTNANNIVDARKNLGYVGMFFAQAVFGAECINIPANADLNTLTYTATGKYYTPFSSTAQSFANCPARDAFQMLVYDLLADATGQATGPWHYRTRIIMTYIGDIFIQTIGTNGSSVISYGAWRKITMA